MLEGPRRAHPHPCRRPRRRCLHPCHRRFASKLHRLRGAGRMLPPGSFSVFGDDCHRERDASFVTVVGILLLQLPSALDSVLASNARMPPRYSKLVLCSTGGRDLWRISFGCVGCSMTRWYSDILSEYYCAMYRNLLSMLGARMHRHYHPGRI